MVNRKMSKMRIFADMFLDINGGASTKRIVGIIGYISGLVLAFMHYEESLVAIVLGSAVSLILGTALEKKYDFRGEVEEPSPHSDIKFE